MYVDKLKYFCYVVACFYIAMSEAEIIDSVQFSYDLQLCAVSFMSVVATSIYKVLIRYVYLQVERFKSTASEMRKLCQQEDRAKWYRDKILNLLVAAVLFICS